MSEGKKIPERAQIDEQFKWRVEDIYANNEDWHKDLQLLQTFLPEVEKFSGRLGESEEVFLECLELQNEIGQLIDRVYLYAAMRQDEDNTVPVYQAMRDNAERIAIELSAAWSFFSPEILSLSPETIEQYLADPQIELYKKMITDITRRREHTLPPAEEKLLAASGDMAASFDNIFTMLNNADMVFPDVANDKGEREQLTHGNYISFLQSHDRSVRKGAFDALYATYAKSTNTIAAVFSSSVKKNIFYARARNYQNPLAASLFDDNIQTIVYDKLIESVRSYLPLFHKYLDLRRRLLNLDELHMYDLYVPVINVKEKSYKYDEAKRLVISACEPLGQEYTGILSMGLASGWVDVYENKGKTSGAYSSGVHGTSPYMLLNYQDNLNGVFTLAHEAGHSMHSYYSWQEQPYVYSSYRIFVAEVASTVNENLLIDYMLHHSDNKEEAAIIVNHYLEEFRGTVFRQTMFAEFEKIVHEAAQNGEALTASRLNEIYYQLNKDYFGDGVVIDKTIAGEWARIPHFYRPFYVYKYATGFCAASVLALSVMDNVETRAEAARKRYIEFLSSGSSADPLDLLKKAGVDMNTSYPISAAMNIFENMVKRLEFLTD